MKMPFADFLQALRCKRGTVAIVLAFSIVPLIGIAALGTEGGLWYVVKRQTQNAADAAAYSGAIQLAEDQSTTNVDSAARQFAAQNGFCSSGSSSYNGSTCTTLSSGTTQSVQISVGTYSNGSFASSNSGSDVEAIVTQSQPRLLSALFLTGNTNIASTAVAAIQYTANVCVLALTNGLTLGGNSSLSGGNCTLMSDTTVTFNSTETFTGTGWAVNSSDGCSGSCTEPVTTNYHALPVADPLASTLSPSLFSGMSGGSSYSLHHGSSVSLAPGTYGDLTLTNGATVTLNSSGTYFFNSITMNGGTLTSGSNNVNIVLSSSGSGVSITGGSTVSLSALMDNSQYPELDGVLFYLEGTSGISIHGNPSITYSGIVYAPNAAVTWHGTPATGSLCAGVIASSVTITGNASLSTGISGCPSSIVPKTASILLVE